MRVFWPEKDGSLINCDGGDVELGEVDSSDGDNLSDNVVAVDEDSVLVDDVDDNSEFALVFTVVNVDNSTNLNEFIEHLFSSKSLLHSLPSISTKYLTISIESALSLFYFVFLLI